MPLDCTDLEPVEPAAGRLPSMLVAGQRPALPEYVANHRLCIMVEPAAGRLLRIPGLPASGRHYHQM